MENSLLQERNEWETNIGQDLSITGFIHLFNVKVDEHYQKIAPAPIISAAEKEKASRFFKQEDRANYITAKHFLRLILSRFLETAPDSLVFQYSGNKKPFLPGIHFNLSHSKNHVIIAVSEYQLGVDVEYIDPDFAYKDLLDTCFDIHEKDFILNGVNPAVNFYTLWTRKEALLKATGQGLVDQLKEVPGLLQKVNLNQQVFQINSFKNNHSYVTSLASTPDRSIVTKLWEL